MKTQPTLFDLRSLINTDNAAKASSGGDFCKELLAELNNELHDDGAEMLDPLHAVPILKSAFYRLHRINEKRRLAWAALEIAKNLLKDFADDALGSQEDGGALCDWVNDWTVIGVNEGIGIDAQCAEHARQTIHDLA